MGRPVLRTTLEAMVSNFEPMPADAADQATAIAEATRPDGPRLPSTGGAQGWMQAKEELVEAGNTRKRKAGAQTNFDQQKAKVPRPPGGAWPMGAKVLPMKQQAQRQGW